MAISINDKKDCTGCGACYNVCPKNCIEMREDKCGFAYPVVDESNCINCKLCEKVCPIQFPIDSEVTKKEVYAAWSKSDNLRYISTSGGLFSVLSHKFLDFGGVVAGAGYDENCNIRHTIVSEAEDISQIRQSKYAQSTIGSIYKDIENELKSNKKVLFAGCPCQVAGLKKYLTVKKLEEEKLSNLLAVDFICRGVNSHKAYKEWLKELEEAQGSKATRVWFKYKEYGWKKSPTCTRVDFSDGQYVVKHDVENTFMSSYLGLNIFIRPSCSKCLFKDVVRHSDITLADFWGAKKEVDDDKGTSLVLINSEKGRELFESCLDDLRFEKQDYEKAISGNPCFSGSVVLNSKSEEFLSRLGEKPFSLLIKEYSKVSVYKCFSNKMKSIIHRFLNCLKRKGK